MFCWDIRKKLVAGTIVLILGVCSGIFAVLYQPEEKTNEIYKAALKDYNEGLKVGKETGTPVFIDFTGFTCTNCRWMEQNMFKRTEIINRMKGFVKVKLYTDRKEEPYVSNKKLQESLYGSIELPLYVIVSPDGEHVGTKTFTRDMQEFVDFLDKGLATARK